MLDWKKKGDILNLLDGWQQSAGELALLRHLMLDKAGTFGTIAQLEEKLDTLAASRILEKLDTQGWNYALRKWVGCLESFEAGRQDGYRYLGRFSISETMEEWR